MSLSLNRSLCPNFASPNGFKGIIVGLLSSMAKALQSPEELSKL
jgi:hypothetical protein